MAVIYQCKCADLNGQTDMEMAQPGLHMHLQGNTALVICLHYVVVGKVKSVL